MYRRNHITGILVFITLLIASISLTACSGSADPAVNIERYIRALTDKEPELMINHSCATWEADARMEYDSFATVETRLEGLSCETISNDGNTARIQCKGAIIATYGDEDQELNLANNLYLAILEGGDWRMCGYE